ncbi:prepilin peptidase [Candidatus Gottesmanbacteria bacterium]|nr:prepilin peptidase [Candidatus Gottesmanbacteria bacterium]
MVISAIVFFIGTLIGSFLNVVIDRIPANRSIIRGRSHCDFCKHVLGPRDLVPIISFLLLRGRCRFCHKKISVQYPLVELFTGSLFLGVFATYVTSQYLSVKGLFIQLLPSWVLISCFIVIFVTDLKYTLIPDEVIILSGIAAFILIGGSGDGRAIWENLVSGGIFSLIFFFLFFITRGKGMGFGDVKLSFVLGLILGLPRIIIAFYLSFLTGAIVSLILLLQGKKKLKSTIPFGPFLVVGTVIAYVWGDTLWVLFKRIVGI